MLFDEIIFLVEAILDEGYKQTVDRRKGYYLHENKFMGRAAYDLYLSIEQIQRNMDLALTHYFPIDYEVLCADTTNFDSAQEKWIYFTNRDFKLLDSSVCSFVQKAQQYKNMFHSSGALHSFFSYKSSWVAKFSKKYQSGVVNATTIETRYLLFARPFDEMSISGLDSNSFVHEPFITQLDISTDEKRLDIEELAKKNIEKISDIKKELRQFIMKHCTMEEIL